MNLIGSFRQRLKSKASRTILRATMPTLAKVFRHVAHTGQGTDLCLKEGYLPMPVHFYQPIPDIEDLDKRGIWNQKFSMTGVELDVEKQLAEIARLGKQFGDECEWPQSASNNILDFHTQNGTFSYGCGSSLHCIIRDRKPFRLIEVGSGNSSKIISSALAKNEADGSPKANYTIIDPYPNDYIKKLPSLSELKSTRVELCDPKFFAQLQKNDILFIDSSHVVKQGSDVVFLILEILPRLNPGVLVHFHDIPLPWDYDRFYATNPSFRVFWNESYLLHAFLVNNSKYNVYLSMNLIQSSYASHFETAFRKFDPKSNWSKSGSFWIVRSC